MSYYKKKIIMTPVISPPHQKSLSVLNYIASANLNFSENYNQDYLTHNYVYDMNVCRFETNFNISQDLPFANKMKDSTVNIEKFEFKPRLNTSRPNKFEFKPKSKNTAEQANNLTNFNLDLIPKYTSQKENILCNTAPIQLIRTKSNEKIINNYKLSNIGSKKKKFKFDNYKNNFKKSKIQSNHINQINIKNENKMIENSCHRYDMNNTIQTLMNSTDTNSLLPDYESYNYNSKSNDNFGSHVSEPDHNTPNSDEWFAHIPKELEQILDHSSHSNNCSSNNNSKINEYEKGMDPYINIYDLKTLDKIDVLSNLCPNNSEQETCKENNDNKHLFNNTGIVQNMESLLTKRIQTNILDLKVLNKIDDLTNLCSNNSVQKLNKNEEKLIEIDSLQNLKSKNKLYENNFLNITPTSILESNKQYLDVSAFNVTSVNSTIAVLDSNSSSKIDQVSKLSFNDDIKLEENEINDTKIKEPDVKNINFQIIMKNMESKLQIEKNQFKISTNNFVIQPISNETEKNKFSENTNTVLDTKTLSKVNHITHFSLNDFNQIDKNNVQKEDSNKSYGTENITLHNNSSLKSVNSIKENEQIKTSIIELNKINQQIPINTNKQTKSIKRKNYVLEIDETCTEPPPRTVQTKITSLLKSTKKSPDLEEQKPENANKKHSCVLKSCLDISAEKRKITDHFPVIKESKISVDKKLKTSKAEKLTGEKKQVPKFKKNKFFTPLVKPESQENNKYDVCILDEDKINILENNLSVSCPVEISFNVIFKENCCLLSQTQTGNMAYNPIGIMFHISWSLETITKNKNSAFYYIDLSKSSWKDISILRELLKKCFTNDCRKVCFKAQSLIILLMDIFSFSIDEIELNWIILDPLVGCWLLDPDHPVSTFSDVQNQLKAKEFTKISTSNVMDTCCDMLIQLSLTTKKLQSLLEEKNLWKIFVNMEMKILTILSGMEFYGLPVDINMLKGFGKILKKKLEIIEKKAYESIGRIFQINSTVQLRSILYDELKLDVKNDISIQQTTTLGAKSTSEPMLQLLQKVHPLPGLILEYRHLSKVNSTYVDAIIQHVKNGIIYSTWEQTSAATGRISSSNPNLQAIPKQPFPLTLFPENAANEETKLHLRSAYISRPGYSLLAADFHHIELRVFAHLSEDKTIIKALNEPGDIFMTLTKTWLGNSTVEISKKQREETKRLVYATMYGAGPAKIAGILKITLQEATNVIKNFTSKFPCLQEFSRNTIELCRKQGYLRSLSGRCRLFPNINNPIFKIKAQAERQSINFRIQGSAADICKSAMISTQEHLKGFNCKLLLQIHDELVWEVLDEDILKVQDTVQKVMEDTNTICGKIIQFSVPLPVSVSVGKNWGEMKEY